MAVIILLGEIYLNTRRRTTKTLERVMLFSCHEVKGYGSSLYHFWRDVLFKFALLWSQSPESSNSDIQLPFVSFFLSSFLKDSWIKVWSPLLCLNCPWWVRHTWADTHQTPADREHSRVHTHSDQAGIYISNLNLPSASSRLHSLWPASKMTEPHTHTNTPCTAVDMNKENTSSKQTLRL